MAKEKKENKKHFGIDVNNDKLWLHNGEILINDDIEAKSTATFLQQIEALYLHDKANGFDRPIKILVNSYGGYCSQGFAIYDKIRHMIVKRKKRVICHATGIIASMAVPIYLATDERTADRNALFMIHGLSSGTSGKIKDMEIDIAMAKLVSRKLWDVITTRSNITKSEIEKYKEDTWFDTNKAKKLGIVKRII